MIPNEEQVEAGQHALDVKKAAIRDQMSPEARARFDVIEQAVHLLEANEIPFALFASHAENLGPEGARVGFWQYNKLCYAEDFQVRQKHGMWAVHELMDAVMRYFTTMAPRIVLCKDDYTPLAVWKGGQRVAEQPRDMP